jgi:hypothetical protein
MSLRDKKKILLVGAIVSGALALISAIITIACYAKYSNSYLYSMRFMKSIYDLGIDFHFTYQQLVQIDYLLTFQFAYDTTCTQYGCWISDIYTYFTLDQVDLNSEQMELLKQYSDKHQGSALLWGGLITLALLAICFALGGILIASHHKLCSAVDEKLSDLKLDEKMSNMINFRFLNEKETSLAL